MVVQRFLYYYVHCDCSMLAMVVLVTRWDGQ